MEVPDKVQSMGQIDLFEIMFKMILNNINTLALKILMLQKCIKGLPVTGSLDLWVECLLMVWETKVQSQVESYQKLFKKWYLIPPYLTLSIIRYISRVKWSNPGKGVAPSPTPWYNSYWKGSLWVTLDYSREFYFMIVKIHFHTLHNWRLKLLNWLWHKIILQYLVWWPHRQEIDSL